MPDFCKHDAETMTCLECGHVAKKLPTFRRCKPPPSPRERKPPKPLPGTELKAALAAWPWKIKETKDCLCGPMADKMNRMGCDWCLGEGRPEILETMHLEAKKRKLPWIPVLADLAIRRAVARARRKAGALMLKSGT